MAIKDDVLYALKKLRVDLLVHLEHTRVYDTHIETSPNGVKEKHTVHRLADLVISTKREGYVTNTTTRQTSGALDFDLTHRFDEVEGVRIVLFNPCRYSKDVGIEDDIAGRNTNFPCKNLKGALTNADLIVPGGGLASDGEHWIACRRRFFLPVRVLSRLFRRRFLEAQQQAIDERPGYSFYNLNIDAGAVWARRLIDGLVAREQPARTVVPIRAAA